MKPIAHAVLAAAYIVGIVSVFNALSSFADTAPHPFLAPMTMLGLLTLSVTVMGYLFIYQPVALLIDKQPRAALMFFGRTVLFFALFVALCLGVLVWFLR